MKFKKGDLVILTTDIRCDKKVVLKAGELGVIIGITTAPIYKISFGGYICVVQENAIVKALCAGTKFSIIRQLHNTEDNEDRKIKTKRKWTPWRIYTKPFATGHGTKLFAFSVRSNGKRTVCRTYVVEDDGRTIKIQGVSTCNEKAGDEFSAEFGFAKATARCESALAEWLLDNWQQKINALKKAETVLMLQSQQFAMANISIQAEKIQI